MNKAIFLDRDGVIVKNINGVAPMQIADMELIKSALTVIHKLQKDFLIIIVSNQPDAAAGIITERTKQDLVKKFEELLKKEKINAKIYYCFKLSGYFHKPQPGMLIKAIKKYNIDPAKSFMIGDRASDIKAGNLVNVKTILLSPLPIEEFYLNKYQVKPDYRVQSLEEVLKII